MTCKSHDFPCDQQRDRSQALMLDQADNGSRDVLCDFAILKFFFQFQLREKIYGSKRVRQDSI